MGTPLGHRMGKFLILLVRKGNVGGWEPGVGSWELVAGSLGLRVGGGYEDGD